MKKIRVLVLLTAMAVILSGCQFFLPFSLRYSVAEQETAEAPLPIGSDVAAHLDAEDIYYRAKFASSNEIYQYTQELTFHFEEDYNGIHYPYQVLENRNITLSDEDCAVNIIGSFYQPDYPEDVTAYQEYYRDENSSLIYYYADPGNDLYIRELVPLEGYTPYSIIVAYHVNSVPYTLDELTLEPQTRILDGREVYVLNAPQNALYVFGSTGNEDMDTKLAKRTIPSTWYIDAETYLPVQEKFTLSQIDDLLWQVIDQHYVVGDLDDGVSFTGFTYVCKFESFEPVEIDPIPADVLQKALANSGIAVG